MQDKIIRASGMILGFTNDGKGYIFKPDGMPKIKVYSDNQTFSIGQRIYIVAKYIMDNEVVTI